MNPDGMSEENRAGRNGSEIEKMVGGRTPFRPARDGSDGYRVVTGESPVGPQAGGLVGGDRGELPI